MSINPPIKIGSDFNTTNTHKSQSTFSLQVKCNVKYGAVISIQLVYNQDLEYTIIGVASSYTQCVDMLPNVDKLSMFLILCSIINQHT